MKRSFIFFAMGLALTSMVSAQSIPDGSYKQSCKEILMTGTTLRAECATGAYTGGGGYFLGFGPARSPVFNRSELANANLCKSVENIKGKLQCVAVAPPGK